MGTLVKYNSYCVISLKNKGYVMIPSNLTFACVMCRDGYFAPSSASKRYDNPTH